ncbi:MAG TPA: hypothetical protein VKT52_05015 [Ktedonobacterales bacterium]|nr:hypothetical protein [Ktedonobacterales bacterium]
MQSPEPPTSDSDSDMQIVQMLRAVQEEARRKIDTTLNPKAQALLEATAEVIGGLIRAYEDFEQGQERAWQ